MSRKGLYPIFFSKFCIKQLFSNFASNAPLSILVSYINFYVKVIGSLSVCSLRSFNCRADRNNSPILGESIPWGRVPSTSSEKTHLEKNTLCQSVCLYQKISNSRRTYIQYLQPLKRNFAHRIECLHSTKKMSTISFQS